MKEDRHRFFKDGLVVKILLICILAIFSFNPSLSCAQSRDIQHHDVRFEKGSYGTVLNGQIKGHQIIDYRLRARAGQVMTVAFKPSNPSAYFNVLPPGSQDLALFVGSMGGNHFKSPLPTDGVYTLRVYLMRNAARRHETAQYTLDVKITGGDKNSAATMFNQTLELYGIRFQVMSTNNGSLNTLLIVPTGLEIDNSPILQEINGRVIGAEIADLNCDGSPEIYVYVTSAGSGSYGSLVAYSANRRKSLSSIYLPPIMDNQAAKKGYMGHDEFAVVETTLVRRFPIYQQDDINAKPTGGMRQLQYKLIPGEAGWILKVDKVIEY